MKDSILPRYSKVIYPLNSETGFYVQQTIERRETPINRLPLQLRKAPAASEQIKSNASTLLLSKECNKGKYLFITGIQPTKYQGWYLGNDYEYHNGQKSVSIILFQFPGDGSQLHVYYFYRYDKPNTAHRMNFANAIIPIIANSSGQ